MVTRCPSCNTLFRVTPQQLQTRHGQVRCGRCTMVFDGFKGLAALPDRASAEFPGAVKRNAAPNGAAAEETAEAERAQVAAPARSAAQATGASMPAGFVFEPLEARDSSPARADPEAAPPRAAFEQGSAADREAPPSVGRDVAPFPGNTDIPRRSARAWIGGVLLLLLALATQAAYFFRGDIAARYPLLKPLVVQACQLFQCSVPLPRKPSLILIEASDLQTVDPARPGLIQLTATLRNHAGFDVAYPALDLVLTNTKEHTLARRIFLPDEYLDETRNAQDGFPARGEITVRLYLDTGELGAAGFRLDLLPSPGR